MKFLFSRRSYLAFLLLLPLFQAFRLADGDTIVYLVRHAEKDMSDPKNRNPVLLPVGEERAKHLATKLRMANISAVYTTNFLRTVGTVTPLATQQGLPIQYYQGTDYPAMLDVFRKEKGKTILVCGHSDNLLPIIRQAGAKPPLETIADTDYSNLFRLVIHSDGTAEATVETYN